LDAFLVRGKIRVACLQETLLPADSEPYDLKAITVTTWGKAMLLREFEKKLSL
jgi:hypothetical protein